MPNDTLPEWEQVLSAAAHLQRILPGAVLVGGSAAAVYAGHRLSTDADHVLTDLRERFDQVLADLEAVAGWKTARIRRPVQILGSLDGIETGVRQLIREEPLETTQIEYQGQTITLPTEAEMLRIKAVLILQRNATRDYLDFVALAHHMGDEKVVEALRLLRSPVPSTQRRIGLATVADSTCQSAALRSGGTQSDGIQEPGPALARLAGGQSGVRALCHLNF
jgi:hypothetical protein